MKRRHDSCIPLAPGLSGHRAPRTGNRPSRLHLPLEPCPWALAAASGFTLVEILVTLAVAGIFVGLLYQMLITQQRGYRTQEELADAQQNARVGVDELTRAFTSLGAGTDVAGGQPRLVLTHEYEISFTADRSDDFGAQTPGTTIPGATPQDPYLVFPPGTYGVGPAETYRYRLVQRPGESFFTLYRQVNGGASQQVALLVANPKDNTPLFRYEGDLDGDGSYEVVDRVDRTTSPRIAAGEPLDAVIRKIELTLITETANPDRTYTPHQGHRQVRLSTSVTPRNLWDCPIVTPSQPTLALAGPSLVAGTTPVGFVVTRGGVPEAGRTVRITVTGPAGHGVDVFDPSGGKNWVTDGAGRVTALVTGPATCDQTPLGTYTVSAQTAEPPSLSFPPLGACAPHEASTDVVLGPGFPDTAVFGATATPPGEPLPPPAPWPAPPVFDTSSCGDSVPIGFRVLDACRRTVDAADASAHPLAVQVGTAEFGALDLVDLGVPTGTVTYTSRLRNDYNRNFTALRAAADPDRYDTVIKALPRGRQADIHVFLEPDRLVPPTTWAIDAASFTDCPGGGPGPLPAGDVFAVEDRCGNRLTSLASRGTPVEVTLTPETVGGGTPDQGVLSSPNNPSGATDPLAILNHNGTPGAFEFRYMPPGCSLGGLTFHPTIFVTPTWRSPTAPVATLRPDLTPCATCSTEITDAVGVPTDHLDQVCDAESRVVVTQCVPTGTTARVSLTPVAGPGEPSFDRNGTQSTTVASFPGGPPGAPQSLSLPLYIGDAQSGASFRVETRIPDPSTVPAGTPGVVCISPVVSVDTRCSEILISPVADNPQPVPANPPAQDTPLCAAEGSEVFFRVKDCDQNTRDNAPDDIQRTAGANKGMIVEVIDGAGLVLDRESPDLFETNVRGLRTTDSPYFQGILGVTLDPADREFSGLLRASRNQVLTVRARYIDPNDSGDRLCVARALLVPPVPVCLPGPVLSFGAWRGQLNVRGGDAMVAGDLVLPAPPLLIEKLLGAPLAGSGPTDRFSNVYVGGEITVGAIALAARNPVDQPFLPGGAGAPYGTTQGNYFQDVPDTAALLARLDYDRLKALARARNVYWETEPGGALFNPATQSRGTFEEVTVLPGPGTATPTHDGEFLFVDGPPGLRTAGQVDQAPTADLPVHTVRATWYSEGLLYVAGSVVLAPHGGRHIISTEAAATSDTRYDENQGGLTRSDLPIDFTSTGTPVAAGNTSVNLRGVLYADGEVTLADPVAVYGVVAAERGVRTTGAPEIRYDPRWRESRLELCTLCCGLSIDPTNPTLFLGGATLQLTAVRPQGKVVWSSLAPAVADVDADALVTPLGVGTTVIRAVDDSGCVAEVEVVVSCGLKVTVHPSAALTVGDTATVSAVGHVGGLSWASDNPATLPITNNFGAGVAVEATAIGGARLTAADTVGCEAAIDFTVNCATNRTLVATPTTAGDDPPAPIAPGDTVTLDVLDAGQSVGTAYTFAANGTALPDPSYTFGGTAPVTFGAALAGSGQCPVTPVTVTPVCPTYRLTADATTVAVGTPVTLTARDPGGANVTPSFTFSADPSESASVTGNQVTPSKEGAISVSGIDTYGCAVGALTLTVTP